MTPAAAGSRAEVDTFLAAAKIPSTRCPPCSGGTRPAASKRHVASSGKPSAGWTKSNRRAADPRLRDLPSRVRFRPCRGPAQAPLDIGCRSKTTASRTINASCRRPGIVRRATPPDGPDRWNKRSRGHSSKMLHSRSRSAGSFARSIPAWGVPCIDAHKCQDFNCSVQIIETFPGVCSHA